MLKKLLTLTLVFVGIFALAGCQETETMTDLEKLQEATTALELPAATGDQLTLPTTGLHGVAVAWSSDNPAVITDEGVIIKPLFGQPNVTVTMTATITLGGQTFTKDFEVSVLAKLETEESDAEKATRLLSTLILVNTNLVGDIELVTAHQGYDLTWTSSNTDVLANDGTVTRPGEGEDDASITLTASITIGTETATKDFTITVQAEESAYLITDISDYYNSTPAPSIDDYIEFTGIVTDVFQSGYVLSDGTDTIAVFTYTPIAGVAVGDQVHVKGFLAWYHFMPQISNPVLQEILQRGQTNPLEGTEVEKTVAELIAMESTELIHGKYFTVTGVVGTVGQYNNLAIFDGNDSITVYYKSLGASQDALEAYIGSKVTIRISIYTFHDEDGLLVLFSGEDADISEVALSDAELAQIAHDQLVLAGLELVEADLTLPVENTGVGATITWASDNEAVIATDGTVTMVNGSQTTVTLTATITVGSETLTKTFTATVADADTFIPVSISTALLEADETSVLVTGIVTATYSDYGSNELVIQDPVTGDSLYVNSDMVGVVVGDEVVVRGTLSTYTSYGNDQRRLNSAILVENVDSDNTILVDAETDVPTIFAEFNEMRRYTATFTVTLLDDGYGYVLFNTVDVEGVQEEGFKFKKSLYAPYFDELYEVGDTIEITFTAVSYSFNNVFMGNVVLPAFTDEQALTVAIAEVEVPTTVTADLEPIASLHGVAIAWSSSDETVIANDGTVVRPANGDGDATVTLTAVFTIGSLSQTETYTVTVPEEAAAGAADLFISEYIEGSSNNKAIEIYNPTGGDVDLSAYMVKQNKGSLVLDYQLTGTLAAGEVFVICADGIDASAAGECDVTLSYTGSGTVAHFNGNDTLQLYKNDVVIDQLFVEADAGGADFAKDITLVRNAGVTSGSTVYDSNEWTEYATDTFTYLGSHTE